MLVTGEEELVALVDKETVVVGVAVVVAVVEGIVTKEVVTEVT